MSEDLIISVSSVECLIEQKKPQVEMCVWPA